MKSLPEGSEKAWWKSANEKDPKSQGSASWIQVGWEFLLVAEVQS